MSTRQEDFEAGKKRLADLSDQELESYFGEMARKIAEPLVEFARTHTSPSIERSVLLRMGFSSVEAQEIVARASSLGLLGKGAGHIVLRLAAETGLELRPAGLAFAAGELSGAALAAFGRK